MTFSRQIVRLPSLSSWTVSFSTIIPTMRDTLGCAMPVISASSPILADPADRSARLTRKAASDIALRADRSAVYTENLIRVDDVMESLKLAE
jgi:hypothetical protein